MFLSTGRVLHNNQVGKKTNERNERSLSKMEEKTPFQQEPIQIH